MSNPPAPKSPVSISKETRAEILKKTLEERVPFQEIASLYSLSVDVVHEIVEEELQQRIREAFSLDKFRP